MVTESESYKQLYQLIGRIFYATAQADKEVHPQEIERLKTLVNEKWLNFTSSVDEFGVNSAYQIKIVFDYLNENKIEETQILEDLKKFKSEHPTLFKAELIDLILSTANSIASSFAFLNKSELTFLSQLQFILKR